MKRGRNSLTGGTGDVSPQFLTFSIAQSAADTTTTISQSLPVDRITSSNNPTIIEVLKVFFSLSAGNAVEVDNQIFIQLSTKNFGTTPVNFGEPSVFASFFRNFKLTTSGIALEILPFIQDITDGAGHGVLIGTDQVFAQVYSTTTGVAVTAQIKMLYRYKRVGLAEYIGIVQSQQ